MKAILFAAASALALGTVSAPVAAAQMNMPGMFICAIAGAETVPSASALAAANSIAFTLGSPLKRRRRGERAASRFA